MKETRLKRRACEGGSTFLRLALYVCVISVLAILCTVFVIPKSIEETEETSYSRRRTALYKSMAEDLEKHGAKFLEGGTTSQSLSMSDIFLAMDGKLEPILKPADPPVRATVLYLDPIFAKPISDTVKRIIASYFPSGIWYQDPKLYHFSLFHASHHLEPILATSIEIDKEAEAVEIVPNRCCELSIVLEKVILTSTGVVLGCWQVSNGTDPTVIRRELKRSLDRAPSKQLYNEVMLHTSVARIVRPSNPNQEVSNRELLPILQQLVSELDSKLRNFEAKITELWFVEELDVLALALNGHMKVRKFQLRCHS